MSNENLKLAMNLRSLNSIKLAEIMGVPQPRVSEWISGVRTPSFKNVTKLANALDCDVAWIDGSAQTLPVYDSIEDKTHICPIIRSEELPGDAGMLYHVCVPETNDVVSVLIHHGEQFTPHDWQSIDSQAQTTDDIATANWLDVNGHEAIMIHGLPYRFA